MSKELSQEMIDDLVRKAQRKVWTDDEEFMVYDYCGGNMDDAFYGGCDAGETNTAREILDVLGIDY